MGFALTLFWWVGKVVWECWCFFLKGWVWKGESAFVGIGRRLWGFFFTGMMVGDVVCGVGGGGVVDVFFGGLGGCGVVRR